MHLNLKTNPQFQHCILILAYLCVHLLETKAQEKDRLMISGRLSKAICLTAEKYITSKIIQKPLSDASKFSHGDKSSCKKLKWNKCGSEKECKTFDCSSSLPPKIKTRSNRKQTASTRIVGGTNAVPYEFPYQIQFKKYGHHCGGSILNENYIISAAHCFHDSDETIYTVVAGEHNIRIHEGKEQERKIKRIIIHEEYNTAGTNNDIALIELESTLALTRYVHPIILPKANYVAKGDAVVSGWGSLRYSGPGPDILQKVTVPIVSHADCQKAYSNNVIGPSMMCAGILGVGGKDACSGDSGGPLAIKMKNGSYLLVGIVSWGIECARAEFPGVYTEVAKYIDWIYKNAT